MLPSLLPSVIYQPSSLSPLSPLFRLILQPLQLVKKGRFKRIKHPSPPGFFSLFRSKKRTIIVFNYLFFSLSIQDQNFPFSFQTCPSRLATPHISYLKISLSFFTIYYPLSLSYGYLPADRLILLSFFSFTS